MIYLLFQVLAVVIVVGAMWYIVTLLPLPAPFPRIIQVILVVILVLVLLNLLMSVTGMGGYWLGGRGTMYR